MFGFFPRLKERATQLAGTLSGGEQQMLAMSRAILEAEAAAARRAVDGPLADHGRRSSKWCAKSRRRASRCCWSSRTPALRCRRPTAAT